MGVFGKEIKNCIFHYQVNIFQTVYLYLLLKTDKK